MSYSEYIYTSYFKSIIDAFKIDQMVNYPKSVDLDGQKLTSIKKEEESEKLQAISWLLASHGSSALDEMQMKPEQFHKAIELTVKYINQTHNSLNGKTSNIMGALRDIATFCKSFD